MPIYTVDEAGVEVPSLETATGNVRAEFRQLFGDDIALDAQTPQGQLIGVIGIWSRPWSANPSSKFRKRHWTSTPRMGVWQDWPPYATLLRIIREQASRSRVTATLTGVSGTQIPAGSRARTTAGAEFRTVASVNLSPAPGVEAVFESVDEGAIAAAANTLTQIVTVIPGWETVANAESAVLGTDRQNDASYRTSYYARIMRNASGPVEAIRSALSEAGATRLNPAATNENRGTSATTVQQWTTPAHHLLFIVEGGLTADLTRAVENYRGAGVGTMTAIRGATPDDTALDGVSSGTVNWNGTDYTGLDLSSASTQAAKATALTALLSSDPVPPTIAAIDGVYVAQFPWHPDRDPTFANNTVETDFGLNASAAEAAPGPFVRPHTRALDVSMTVTRGVGFPADGLTRIRSRVTDIVDGYGIGQAVWLNDLLSAAEGVPGTQVSAVSVQYQSTDVSGISPPLDSVWSLPSGNLTITFT